MEIRKIKRNKLKNWKSKNKYPRPNKIGQYWRNMQIKLKGEIPFLMEFNATTKLRMSNKEIYYLGIKEIKSRSSKHNSHSNVDIIRSKEC